MVYNENGELLSLNEQKNVSDGVKKAYKDMLINIQSLDTAKSLVKIFIKDPNDDRPLYQNAMKTGFSRMIGKCTSKDDYKWVIKKIRQEIEQEQDNDEPSKEYIDNLKRMERNCKIKSL